MTRTRRRCVLGFLSASPPPIGWRRVSSIAPRLSWSSPGVSMVVARSTSWSVISSSFARMMLRVRVHFFPRPRMFHAHRADTRISSGFLEPNARPMSSQRTAHASRSAETARSIVSCSSGPSVVTIPMSRFPFRCRSVRSAQTIARFVMLRVLVHPYAPFAMHVGQTKRDPSGHVPHPLSCRPFAPQRAQSCVGSGPGVGGTGAHPTSLGEVCQPHGGYSTG